MTFELVQLQDVAPTSWANGGGVTRELLAWPASSDWTLRLSVAEVVRDGPFSRLPGVRRWFCVLQGEGVRLCVDGVRTELTRRSAPFEFDGSAQTDCELLASATRDFNLMLRRGAARMERINGVHSRDCRRGQMVAVYAQQGAHLRIGGERITMAGDTLAWRILESDSRVELSAQDALWMEVEP